MKNLVAIFSSQSLLLGTNVPNDNCSKQMYIKTSGTELPGQQEAACTHIQAYMTTTVS